MLKLANIFVCIAMANNARAKVHVITPDHIDVVERRIIWCSAVYATDKAYIAALRSYKQVAARIDYSFADSD